MTGPKSAGADTVTRENNRHVRAQVARSWATALDDGKQAGVLVALGELVKTTAGRAFLARCLRAGANQIDPKVTGR